MSPVQECTFNTSIPFRYLNICTNTTCSYMLAYMGESARAHMLGVTCMNMQTWTHTYTKTTGGSSKRQSDCSRSSKQELQETSIWVKPTLLGPPVDYSGKDKLPGASINSQQPPLDLKTPEEFWCQEGIGDLPLHTDRYVVCFCCINHWDKQFYRDMERGYKSIVHVAVIPFMWEEWDRLISCCPQKHAKWDFH